MCLKDKIDVDEVQIAGALVFFKWFTITAINLLSTLWLIAKVEAVELFLFSLFLLQLFLCPFSFASILACLI